MRGCEDDGLESLGWAEELGDEKLNKVSACERGGAGAGCGTGSWHPAFDSFGGADVIQSSDTQGQEHPSTEECTPQWRLRERVSVQADSDWCFHRLRNQVNLNLNKDPLPRACRGFAL